MKHCKSVYSKGKNRKARKIFQIKEENENFPFNFHYKFWC